MEREELKVGIEVGLGWLPDYPDQRDYTEEHPAVGDLVQRLKVGKARGLPSRVDLRPWCSPVENQGRLGSCTANAGVGIVEYFEIRSFGRYIDASRLFLYKATRNLLHWTGDTGAFIRTTMAALVLFGVPPEEYWPYTDQKPDFDREPPAFCYAFAQNYQTIRYFRHDPPGTDRQKLLDRVKRYLAAGVPAIFGFTVYASIRQAQQDGKIPYPCPRERVIGGHAVVAVGYDDELEIENKACGKRTKGALLIRNSWGTKWGEKGYGWLPYEYVWRGLARDWWSILKNEWIDTNQFGL